MKILLRDTEVLAIEGNYSLEDGWYSIDHRHYDQHICKEVEVKLPADFRIGRYTYADGVFTQTPQFVEEKLEACRFARAASYPPITDYIDGIVKGDEAQVQEYIDACLAVKAKYPKPV